MTTPNLDNAPFFFKMEEKLEELRKKKFLSEFKELSKK